MRRRIESCLAACALIASLGAHAQEPGVKLNMDTGFYVGGGLGRVETREFCVFIGGGACDQKDTSWNVFVGYQVNRHLAFELGYVDLGESHTTGLLAGIPSTARFDTTAIEFLALGMLPLTDAFTIYGKFGLYRYETDSFETGAITRETRAKDTEFTFGLGAQYSFTRNVAVRAEWQRYLEVGSGVVGMPKTDSGVTRVTGRFMF